MTNWHRTGDSGASTHLS